MHWGETVLPHGCCCSCCCLGLGLWVMRHKMHDQRYNGLDMHDCGTTLDIAADVRVKSRGFLGIAPPKSYGGDSGRRPNKGIPLLLWARTYGHLISSLEYPSLERSRFSFRSDLCRTFPSPVPASLLTFHHDSKVN